MRRTCVILSLIFILACAPVKPVEQSEQAGFRFIEGTVQSISANEIILSLKLPEFKKTSDIPSSEIAQQVVQKSLFLEGIETDINGMPAVIKADGSKKSARIDFNFPEDTQHTYAKIDNRKKRDLSFYDGIEFFAKATKKIYGVVSIVTPLPNNPNRLDDWLGYFVLDTEWKKIRIPFEQLVVAKGWFKYVQHYGATIGDQIWRPNYIEMVRIGTSNSHNNLPVKGTIWIDKISQTQGACRACISGKRARHICQTLSFKGGFKGRR